MKSNLSSLLVLGLATASAHAASQLFERDVVCSTGLYAECGSLLADAYDIQEYCAAYHPVACTTDAAKAKRGKSCRSKVPPTDDQVAAWHRIYEQGEDAVKTLCSCVAIPKPCPSYLDHPGKPKPVGYQTGPKPSGSHQSAIYSHQRTAGSHAPQSSLAGNNVHPTIVRSADHPDHATVTRSAEVHQQTSSAVDEPSHPHSFPSHGPFFNSSIASVHSIGHEPSSVIVHSAGPRSSSAFEHISVPISVPSSEAPHASSSAVANPSMNSASVHASASSSGPHHEPHASGTRTSNHHSEKPSTASSFASSASSAIPSVIPPCTFPNATQLYCSDNGQEFGAICGAKIVRANPPKAAFLFTTNPPEFIDCLNDCANNDFCYVWSFTRDAGGNTCYLYQNVEDGGDYDTAYDFGPRTYSVRGYFNGLCLPPLL